MSVLKVDQKQEKISTKLITNDPKTNINTSQSEDELLQYKNNLTIIKSKNNRIFVFGFSPNSIFEIIKIFVFIMVIVPNSFNESS